MAKESFIRCIGRITRMTKNKIDQEQVKKICAILMGTVFFYLIWTCVLTVVLAQTPYNGFLRFAFDSIVFVSKNFRLDLPFLALFRGYISAFILSAVIAALFTAFVALGGYLTMKRNEKKNSLFGNARWSSYKDLIKAKLVGDKGIVIGKYNGEVLRFNSQEFASLSAPTRSGKGVGVVIPNLLEWNESLVVLDVKQECFVITSKYRQDKLGQKVYLFDPFSYTTSRYNPLEYLNFNDFDIELQIQRLAESLYPAGQGGKDFFVLQSQSVFVAIVYLLGQLKENELLANTFTLTTLAGALNGLKISLTEKVEFVELEEIVETANMMELLTPTIYSRFQSFFAQAEAKDQFIGIKGSYETPLKIFQNSLFEKATETNDFDFRDLRQKKITIYIGITPENIKTAKPILNLFFTQLLFENIKQGLPETNPKLKNKVLLLMDEFTSIGFMEQYQLTITYLAGYNIRSLIIYQNATQLAENPPLGYGDKGSETLLENHACQIIYRPKNPKTAEEISKKIGYITTKSQNKSMSSRDVLNVSSSDNQTQRALILPQELMELEDDEQIIFYNSIKLKCKKAYFYEDKDCIDKLKSVSRYLRGINGFPTKEELEKAYELRETTIHIENLNEQPKQ